MNLVKKLIVGMALMASASIAACEKAEIPAEPEETHISGRILWDQNKDGNYEVAPGTSVFLYNETDSSWVSRLTESDGSFFFRNPSFGKYGIQALKFSSLNMYYEIKWFVVEGKTNLGEIKLKRFPLIPLSF